MLIFADGEKLREVQRQIVVSREDSERAVTFVLPIIRFSTATKQNPLRDLESRSPESLAYDLRERLNLLDVDSAAQQFRKSDNSNLIAGSLAGCRGVLRCELSQEPEQFHSELLLTAGLEQSPYCIELRSPIGAFPQIEAYVDQMVTVYGVCRWTRAYRPGSGAEIEVAIRIVAMFAD